jgi:predicted Fe-S protein YdhL (DUF1289 family)
VPESVMARVSTPCVKVCLIDPETGLCEGCGRTGEEVARWGTLSEEERLGIMAGLEERMRAAFLPAPKPETA